MKTSVLMSLRFFFVVFLTTFCSAFGASSDDGSIPSQLPIGKLAVIQQYSEISTLKVAFSGEKVDGTGWTNISETDVSGFRNLADLAEAIAKSSRKIKVWNPETSIRLTAVLMNKSGDELYESRSSFYLSKRYDSSGGYSYQLQESVGVYFHQVAISVFFPGVLSARIISDDGEEDSSLEVSGSRIVLPKVWDEEFQFLEITTLTGKYLYSIETGQILTELSAFLPLSFVNFFEIVQISPEKDSLVLELYPENGYNPWIETTIDQGFIYIDTWSNCGYRPIAVWVARMSDLRAGIVPEKLPYTDDMLVKGKKGETLYLWFEFSAFVSDINCSCGEKG